MFYTHKTRMIGLPCSEEIVMICTLSHFDTVRERGRWTDGRTDRIPIKMRASWSMHLRNLKRWLHHKNDHVSQTTPLSGNFLPLGGTSVVNPLAKFKQHTLIHSRNIEEGLKFQKRSRDPDHGPFGENFFAPGVGLAVVDPLAKFKECIFIHSRNIDGV